MQKLLPIPLMLALVLTTGAAVAQQAAPPQTAPAPANSLTDYAGSYKFADNGYFTRLVVTVENGKVYGQVDANDKYEFVRQPAPDTFKSTSSYGSVFVFTRSAASRQITGVTMQIQGNELTASREK